MTIRVTCPQCDHAIVATKAFVAVVRAISDGRRKPKNAIPAGVNEDGDRLIVLLRFKCPICGYEEV